MAEKACHAFASTTRFGLTQALYGMTASNSSSLAKGALLIALAAGYYIGLGLVPAITYKLPINELAEWLGASRSVSAYAYLIGTHTIGAILVAVPIALILALSYADRVILLAFLIALPPVIDLVFGLWMFGGIGELRSVPQTIFYITDILKIGLAVPVLCGSFRDTCRITPASSGRDMDKVPEVKRRQRAADAGR